MDIAIRELHNPNSNCKTLEDKILKKDKMFQWKNFSPLLVHAKSPFLFGGEWKVFQNTNLVYPPNQLLPRLIAVLFLPFPKKSLPEDSA